jgi:hypothetical protein
MSNVIDLKSKKKLKKNDGLDDETSIPYLERAKLCAERAANTPDNKCDCVFCVHKEALARKLVTISQWLVVDHCEKNELDLCWADWFDITVNSASKVKDIVYPNLKKEQGDN